MSSFQSYLDKKELTIQHYPIYTVVFEILFTFAIIILIWNIIQ